MAITIGLLIPRSDIYPLFSQYLMRGIKLAFEEKNVAADFIIEDIGKGLNSNDVLGKANQLLIKDVDVCFAYVGHNCLDALADLFEKSEKPLIILHSGSVINYLDGKTYENVFINSLGMWMALYGMGRYFSGKEEKIISSSSFFDSGYQHSSSFTIGYATGGRAIEGHFSSQQIDEATYDSRLRPLIDEVAPTAIALFYSGNDAESVFKLNQDKGYFTNQKILTTQLGYNEKKAKWPNVYIAGTWFAQLNNSVNNRFVAAYTDKYGAEPDVITALSYEAGLSVASAIAGVGVACHKICNYLKQTTQSGPRGEYVYGNTNEGSINNVYVQTPQGIDEVIITTDEIVKVTEDNKTQVVSGWFNPYPCA